MKTFSRAAAVTPSNTTNLPVSAKAIMVGANGTLKVDLTGVGTGVTIQVIAGYLYPINVKRVYATGTSATGIIALY